MIFDLRKEVLLVGETSINHCGDMATAFRLIDMVKESGWHVVKFQMKQPSIFYTEDELNRPLKSPFGVTYGDYVRKRYFSQEEFRVIDNYCKEQNVVWTATPFDVVSLENLMEFDVPYIKISSSLSVNKDFLDACIRTGKPLFISTGMCDLITIIGVATYILERGGDLQLVYHCTSAYPTPPEALNLKAITTLKSALGPNILVGLSSHDTGILSAPLAVSLGARSIERHITIDRGIFGSDQRFSLERDGMKRVARDVKLVLPMLGTGEIKLEECEKPNISRLKRVNTFN